MIGEIVPLLTSPGDLAEKLRLVANRLSIGAGYDFVRFTTAHGDPIGASDSVSTVARMPEEIVDALDSQPNPDMDRALEDLLMQTNKPVLLDDPSNDSRFSEAAADPSLRRHQIITPRPDGVAG